MFHVTPAGVVRSQIKDHKESTTSLTLSDPPCMHQPEGVDCGKVSNSDIEGVS